MDKLPTFIMLIGLPGSGKSDYAKDLEQMMECDIHSSDTLREEMFGDKNYQGTPKDKENLFNELHKRIKGSLLKGNNAVYDATNLNKSRRIHFIKHELKNIECEKICIIMGTPYDVCLENNKKRSRIVPEDVIHKMYLNFQPPHKSEGWGKISIKWYEPMPKMDYRKEKELFYSFDQKNSHHKLTLGQHMHQTYLTLCKDYPDDDLLAIAGKLHDIGKVKTRSFIDKNNKETNEAHYYQHHCAGAYDVMFWMNCYNYVIKTVDDLMDVSNLIYYHMHPYMSWGQSRKAKEKDRAFLGENFFNRVMALHYADEQAHGGESLV